jgi:hypothetical protein
MMRTDTIKRVCLWSGPRNISTALMYSFAQRSDTKVFDEPLYGYYLKNTNAKKYHPGAEEILAAMETDDKKVVEMMLSENSKPVLFFKHMTHHLLDLDRGFMAETVNVILTRNPYDMLPSFAKMIAQPTMQDVGYAQHVELVKDLESRGITPIIIDSEEIVKNPEKALAAFCRALEIPFEKEMLHWQPGGIPEDGIWAKDWYGSVHNSNGFMPYQKTESVFPEHLKSLLNECEPHFKFLKARALAI